MDVLLIIITEVLAIFALITIWFLRKVLNPTKKKRFPSCRDCGKYMGPQFFTVDELPFEMKAYLYKWNLPEIVIRKHLCPDGHNELWIAPAVGNMEKSLFVQRRHS